MISWAPLAAKPTEFQIGRNDVRVVRQIARTMTVLPAIIIHSSEGGRYGEEYTGEDARG